MEVREPQELREIAAEKLGLLGNGKSTQRIEKIAIRGTPDVERRMRERP
jgi:hypothetical protein